MAVTAIVSPGGSPGATTTALALTLAWPGEVVMTECDPAGGSVLAGMWRGQAPPAGGMLRFALAAQRDPRAAGQGIRAGALALDGGAAARLVLPAPPGPQAARQLAPAWPAIAAALASAGIDVIADLGRWDDDPVLAPLVTGADRVLVVCRPLIRHAAAARPRLEALARLRPGQPPAEVLLAGDGPYGLDAPKAFADALGASVRATLPWDPATAAVLSDGAVPRRGFARSPLIRAATTLAKGLVGKQAAGQQDARPAEVAAR